jgi:hypothetical protein
LEEKLLNSSNSVYKFSLFEKNIYQVRMHLRTCTRERERERERERVNCDDAYATEYVYGICVTGLAEMTFTRWLRVVSPFIQQ